MDVNVDAVLPNRILPLFIDFAAALLQMPLLGTCNIAIQRLMEENANGDDTLFSYFCLIYMQAADGALNLALNKKDKKIYEKSRNDFMKIISSYFTVGTPYTYIRDASNARGYSFFKNIFTDYINSLDDSLTLNIEIEKVIKQAQRTANELTRTLEMDRVVYGYWLNMQENDMPFANVVPSSDVIAPNVRYLEQSITFTLSSGKGKRVFMTKAENEKTGEWWGDLYELLRENNYFLHGPGGMGKSNFLRRLYKEIAKRSKNLPYKRVIFVSFYSLSGVAAGASNTGPIIRQIATLAGDVNKAEVWKTVLSSDSEYAETYPVLLLLDGLNELIDDKKNTRNQALKELAELTVREKYPNLHIIFTSRIEDDGEKGKEYSSHINLFQENGVHFLEAEIQGLLNIDLDGLPFEPSDEMYRLFTRPLYYLQFEDKIKNKQDELPRTRYDALAVMYEALSKQSSNNTSYARDELALKCAFEIVLPEIANRFATMGTMRLDSEPRSSTKRLMSNLYQRPFREDDIRIFNAAADLLKVQEQIITYDTSTGYFRFVHQDYGDFLAALYYVQRLELMNSNHQFPPDWIGEFANLDVSKYSRNILKLIYEAVNIKEIEKWPFTIPLLTNRHAFDREYFLRLFTIYQLEDWCHLDDIDYEKLWSNTLTCFQPLEKSLLDLTPTITIEDIHQVLEPDEANEFDKIVLKLVELHRRLNEYDNAYQVLDLFGANLSKTKHNKAKLMLAQAQGNFQTSAKKTELIYNALCLLYECCDATERRPYRFSCNLLSMILVSPQPALKKAYHKFIRDKLDNTSPFIAAFWILYDAVYRNDTDRGRWKELYYPARQMLRLLAENKVSITVDDKDRFRPEVLQEMVEAGTCHIFEGKLPIPTEDNVFVMKQMFSPFYEYADTDFKTYIEVLLNYYTAGPRKALSLLSVESLAQEEVRTQLWYYFLSEDAAGCKQCFMNHKYISKARQNHSFDSYNVNKYFGRDVGQLYYFMTKGDRVQCSTHPRPSKP